MSDLGERVISDEESDEVIAAARQRSRFGVTSEVVLLYVICIGGALALAAVLVAATGGSWTAVYRAMLDGSIRNPGRWGLTLAVSAPILLVGLGTVVNGRAGLVNIGQEGQLVMGASFAAFLASRLAGSGPLALVAILAPGIIGGAARAGIAGVLRYWRNVPEVLTTLLLTTVAANLMGYGLRNRHLLLAPAAGRANRNQVSEPLAGTRIPWIEVFGNEFPLSVFLAVGLALVLWVVLGRTVVGFRLRMLGRNPRTAHRAGVGQRRYGVAAMLVSGALAGLAGGVMLASVGTSGTTSSWPTSVPASASPGLLAAPARQRVLVLIFVAFVFGSLRTGSGFLRATGVSGRIADVVQGLLVLALLLPPGHHLRPRAAPGTRRRQRAA